MSDAAFEIEIIDQEIKELLNKLYSRYTNLTPVMRRIAVIMHNAVEENFEQEGRPRWAALKPSTIRQREYKGHWPGKILQQRGQMAASVSMKSGADFAKVTTADIRAKIHHFGGKAGKGHKATIPARPFMKITSKEMGDIRLSLRDYLFGNFSG